MHDDRDETIETTPRWRTHLIRVQLWSGVILAGYAIALLIGTHLPNPEEFFPMEGNDKWLHFCAYFGLAFLWITWRSSKMRVCWKLTLAVWVATALMGAVDELTQQLPAINRHCDLLDWIADISGSASGLLAWHLLRRTLFADRRSVKLQNDSV